MTESSNPEISSSHKHGRHEGDPQVEGPSKRAKLQRSSEPPLRKDTSTTPKKPKKSRKRVNNRKATRAKTYHELKQSNKDLKLELADAKQAMKDMKQEHDKTLRAKDEAIAAKQEELDKKTNKAAIYKQQRDELRLSHETANKERASMEQRLTSKTRKLTEANERLEKLEQEFEHVRKVNDTNGSWNARLTDKARRAKDSLAKERTGLSSQQIARMAEQELTGTNTQITRKRFQLGRQRNVSCGINTRI